MTVKYVVLHYFRTPVQRTGIPFVLLSCEAVDNQPATHLGVYEAPEWRKSIEPEDSEYLELLLESFKDPQEDVNSLFLQLDSMSAGTVRLVDEGLIEHSALPTLIT